ncbi:MAG: hypothetical protein HFI55_11865 [Lachnospiraceae bacterium]|jgi:uncharacterized protein YjdB|nr:hypothetical protein [Lachnospiraceae bacterium]
MKNMKKLLQKAMVFTLTAAMLIGTPLSASAAGLVDIYKTEDGWGDKVPGSDDDTRTGTVTSTVTSTDTRVLGVDGVLEGIVLSETDVELEMVGAYDSTHPVKESLKVDFVWSDDANHEADEKLLEKKFKWETTDRDIVSLNNPNKNGKLSEMEVVAKAGGKAGVTVSLNDYENNIHFTTTANVTVKQYASELSFSKELDEEAYENVSLTLEDYLVRDPKTASDEVSYEVVRGNGTIKNGVLKLGKLTKGDKVTVIAIGEKVKSEPKEITIKAAVPATKVAIRKVKTTDKITKYDWLVNTESENQFEVVLDTKATKDITPDNADRFTLCTDKITWSSQKPEIVAVQGSSKGDVVTLVPKKVGSSKITAQTSSGKKGTLNVTVRANLTGFEISADTTTLYSGQSIKLDATQYFAAEKGNDKANANFTDAGLTWSFAGEKDAVKAMKKAAKLNAKTGVLTINADVSGVKEITVTATNAKKIGKKGDATEEKAKTLEPIGKQPITFELKQINITNITVYENTGKDAKPIAHVFVDNSGKKPKLVTEKIDKKVSTVTIPAGTTRTYAVVAEGSVVGTGEKVAINAEDMLNWASAKEKVAVATRINGAKRGNVKAESKGSAKITVSGATTLDGGKKYKAISASFTASVTAPTKSIKLSTKNSAIQATGKKQTVTIKAALDKGCTSKTKEIVWEARNITSDNTTLTATGGKVQLPIGSYKAGDIILVTAKIPSAGVQSRMTLKVVEPSIAVEIRNGKTEGAGEIFTVGKKKNNAEIKLSDATTNLQMVSMVNVGTKTAPEWAAAGGDEKHPNVANVTYTVNKKGIVQIVDGEVKGIKAGTVKITATTADGKKATLTVKVTE